MPRASQSSGSCGGGGAARSTTVSFPTAGSPSKPSRYWPDSACQRLPPSFTTTWSPTAPIARPESGISAGRLARRAFSALVMRRGGTFDDTSDCAVRSTIRSWKEKRRALRGPRAGDTKPADTRARTVARGRRSSRSTSSTPYGLTAPAGSLGVFADLLRSRSGHGGYRALGRLALLVGRGRRGLGLRGRGGLLLEARAQGLHEVDHLRGLGLLGDHHLLALDLLLDRLLDAGGDRVGVLAGIEGLGGLRVDELLGELQLRVLHLGLGDLDLLD